MKRIATFILMLMLGVQLMGCAKEELETETETVQEIVITNKESFSGQNLITDELLITNSDIKDILAFTCYKTYDDGTEGGSSTGEYNVVIKNNLMIIYCVYRDTTASNGTTFKYEQGIDESYVILLKNYIENEDWKHLYDEIASYINANMDKGIMVSGGMTDKESRNEDGSYIWETEFYSMFH